MRETLTGPTVTESPNGCEATFSGVANVVIDSGPEPASLVAVTANEYEATVVERPVNGILVAVVVEVVVLVPLFIVTV